MIYTIGRTRDYLMALTCKEVSGQRLHKLGRRQIADEERFIATAYYMKPFPGGSVWATREEAQAFVDSRDLYQFAVFGVEASWDDTADAWDTQAAGWRDLLVDAPVLRLEPEYYERCIQQEAQKRRRLRPQPPMPSPDQL
jgi:hypothetical protein